MGTYFSTRMCIGVPRVRWLFPEYFHKAAGYVDKILRGANSVTCSTHSVQTDHYLKTAKALRLTIQPSLLATADELIGRNFFV
jgi:hypothetical protein